MRGTCKICVGLPVSQGAHLQVKLFFLYIFSIRNLTILYIVIKKYHVLPCKKTVYSPFSPVLQAKFNSISCRTPNRQPSVRSSLRLSQHVLQKTSVNCGRSHHQCSPLINNFHFICCFRFGYARPVFYQPNRLRGTSGAVRRLQFGAIWSDFVDFSGSRCYFGDQLGAKNIPSDWVFARGVRIVRILSSGGFFAITGPWITGGCGDRAIL